MGSILDSVFGSKPTVPTLEKLNLGSEQQKAIDSNIAAAAGASKLAGLTQDQIMKMLSQVDPNFSAQSKDITGNIDAMLRGEIPQDVSDAVARSAAGKSLVGGYGGSEMGRNLTARDLGLTSLDLTAKGLSSAESWLAATERLLSPAMATYTGMFITPQQEYSTDNEQNIQQFQRQWMSNQIEAMPDPGIRGIHDTALQIYGRGGSAPDGSQFQKLQTPGSSADSSSGISTLGWDTATSDMMDSGFDYGSGASAGASAASSGLSSAEMMSMAGGAM